MPLKQVWKRGSFALRLARQTTRNVPYMRVLFCACIGHDIDTLFRFDLGACAHVRTRVGSSSRINRTTQAKTKGIHTMYNTRKPTRIFRFPRTAETCRPRHWRAALSYMLSNAKNAVSAAERPDTAFRELCKVWGDERAFFISHNADSQYAIVPNGDSVYLYARGPRVYRPDGRREDMTSRHISSSWPSRWELTAKATPNPGRF